MPVPVRIYAIARLRQLSRLALLMVLAATPMYGRGPAPSVRISLDSLDFQPQAAQFLLSGSSMMTLHYVDSRHLLFTFGVHRLMERIANDPPDDQDRMVEAVLVEVPSGRVLARTDWRFHDNGQYLWDLGHGRFLLRVRDTLTTFAPMANLASGHPFRQSGFLKMTPDRRIGVVLLSPESDLLIIESAERTPPVAPPPTPLFGPTPKPTPTPPGRPGDPDPVALSFYRLSMPGGDQVKATLAGVARAANFGDLAAIGVGHIGVVEEGKQQWGFDFRPYHGAARELASFGSTCSPTPRFVSSSEFVAFGCHLGNNPQVLGGFNMSGDEMWEQNLFGHYVATSMAFAPSSGRFALARVLGEGGTDDLQPIVGSAFTEQSVVVYQTESGKQILHVDCTPIARAGQNFALSPDGMKLAVIHEGNIEVYDLPPLSAKDQAEVKEARALVPRENLVPLEFAGPSAAHATNPAAGEPEAARDASAAAGASPEVPKEAGVPAAKPSAPAAPAVTSSAAAAPTPVAPAPAKSAAATPAPSSAAAGDATPEQPRKPPTLYNLPDDPARETK